jgi:hypothetical protein
VLDQTTTAALPGLVRRPARRGICDEGVISAFVAALDVHET